MYKGPRLKDVSPPIDYYTVAAAAGLSFAVVVSLLAWNAFTPIGIFAAFALYGN